MKKWPTFKDLFSLRPNVDLENPALGLGDRSAEEPADAFSPGNDSKARWQKIKFDNTIRAWIAIPTYFACVLLKFQEVIPSLMPISIVFAAYGAMLFSANWIFMGTRFGRKFDYVFATVDLVGMSFSIYFTGGTESPLYFLYFIPLIVHAFHRDWGIVIFSGFSGVVLYAAAVLKSLVNPTPAIFTNLGARLFFMLLTVSVACMAINILRRKEAVDRRRLLRLKNLTLVSRELNHLASLHDLAQTLPLITQFVNEGLGENLHSWTRFLLTQEDPSMMKAFEDLSHRRPDLQQVIQTKSCPAMSSNNKFVLDDAATGDECPVESFSFGSHVCIPISGTENESFGVLFAGSPLPKVFREEEFQFLEFVARSLGLAVQRLHRMEELRKSVEMNSCVMAATIASARSSDETFTSVLEGISTILKVERATLMLWDANQGVLRTVKTKGPCTMVERELTFRLGEGLPGKAIEVGEVLCANGAPQNVFGRDENYEIKALLSVPLKTIRGEKLGVINAARVEATEGFSAMEREVVATYAVRAGLAVENALMHDAERQAQRKEAA